MKVSTSRKGSWFAGFIQLRVATRNSRGVLNDRVIERLLRRTDVLFLPLRATLTLRLPLFMGFELPLT